MLCVQKRLGKILAHVVALLLPIGWCREHCLQAGVVTFGSGGDTFNLQFLDIADVGNTADAASGYGSVSYTYRVGSTEVSNAMITVYNTLNSGDTINVADSSSKAAQSIAFYEAAKFVNWMNTVTGNDIAYNIVQVDVAGSPEFVVEEWDSVANPDDYDAANPFRSKRALYALPTVDEYYKAAYYDAATDSYSLYTTGSDTAPTGVASGTAANTAVYNDVFPNPAAWSDPAAVDQAGGLSFYGAMGLGGNVTELSETGVLDSFDGLFYRVALGGGFADPLSYLESTTQNSGVQEYADFEFDLSTGFRVYQIEDFGSVVPEPGSLLLLTSAALVTAGRRLYRRRTAKCDTI